MNTFNPVFFQKYQEIKGIDICNADDFAALHNALNGKTLFTYLGIEENEVDREFLHNCSKDRKCFEREFSGLDFEVFKQSEFVIQDETVFNSYKGFLEYHKIEAVLFDTQYDDDRKIIEICKAMGCTKNEAKIIFEASVESSPPKPIIPTVLVGNINEASSTTELSDDVKMLSELFLELNNKSIKADIQHDALFGYTSYACDTHKKYAPKIIEFFIERWNEAQDFNSNTINQILEEYDAFAELNIASMLFDFEQLPSIRELPTTEKFLKTRYTKEVEPVFLGCAKYYKAKCEERRNYIIYRRVESRLQYTHDVSNMVMEIISDFVDDKTIVKNVFVENVCDDNLIYAAQIYIATVRLQKVTEYLKGVLSEIQRLCNEMHQIARELCYMNNQLTQFKEEYELTFHGEKVLSSLKDVSIFSRKNRKEEKKNELETQTLLLSNLKKYCHDLGEQ